VRGGEKFELTGPYSVLKSNFVEHVVEEQRIGHTSDAGSTCQDPQCSRSSSAKPMRDRADRREENDSGSDLYRPQRDTECEERMARGRKGQESTLDF
jgi:hypothetical protein